MVNIKLHPDDVLFFNEVRTAMVRVAREYGLALRSVEPHTMPEAGMADRLGECSGTGDVTLVMRATVDGKFCEAPRTPADVWRTAAHELAHLRFMNHDMGHQEFTLELLQALQNQQEDHRDKIIKKLVKLQAQAEGERVIGNSEAAEAFAGMVNAMLIRYELNPSDIDYARTAQSDPVVEIRVDLAKYRIDRVNRRVAWQETLARVVSNAHLCTFLLAPGCNTVWFVGTKSHATVAEYVYGMLIPAAEKMSLKAKHDHRVAIRREHGIAPGGAIPRSIKDAFGFREAWLDGFVRRIEERMQEARKEAVRQAVVDLGDAPGAESQAMIRLDGAMVKVRTYIDDKFKSKGRGAAPLAGRAGWNPSGRAAGRAAADAMPIGRRGLTGGSTRGLIGK